jgi:hypothetical protein
MISNFFIAAIAILIAISITLRQMHYDKKLHEVDIMQLKAKHQQLQSANIMLVPKAALATEHMRLLPNFRLISAEIVKLQIIMLELLNSNCIK